MNNIKYGALFIIILSAAYVKSTPIDPHYKVDFSWILQKKDKAKKNEIEQKEKALLTAWHNAPHDTEHGTLYHHPNYMEPNAPSKNLGHVESGVCSNDCRARLQQWIGQNKSLPGSQKFSEQTLKDWTSACVYFCKSAELAFPDVADEIGDAAGFDYGAAVYKEATHPR